MVSHRPTPSERFMQTIDFTRCSHTMPTRLAVSLVAAAAIAVTSACSTLGADDYAYSDARVQQRVAYGVVENVRPVRLSEHDAPVGTIAGAALGGILGNDIGHGLGRAAAT